MSSPEELRFDVFLSYAKPDADIAKRIAERLKSDGLRVWFDQWQLGAADNIAEKIQSGLENARALVLCFSKNVQDAEWMALEANAFQFRDPLNLERWLVPLRLDDTELRGSLSGYPYIEWNDDAYPALLKACRAIEEVTGTEDSKALPVEVHGGVFGLAFSRVDARHTLTAGTNEALELWDTLSGRKLASCEGHSKWVQAVIWSADERRALSSSNDKTIRLWDIGARSSIRTFAGHSDTVLSVAWSRDERLILSGSADHTLRLWETESGKCVRVFDGHSDAVHAVAWSPDQTEAISGSADGAAFIWDIEFGRCTHELRLDNDKIYAVGWSPKGRSVLVAGAGRLLTLFDLDDKHPPKSFEGHTGSIRSIAWHPDGRYAVTCSDDKTAQIFDMVSFRRASIFRAHRTPLLNAQWSADGTKIFTGDRAGVVHIWNAPRHIDIARSGNEEDLQSQYTSAKVVFVGESSAGKTGLFTKLATGRFEPSVSTVGSWSTRWKLGGSSTNTIEREIWLWDFGGQADQRLIHQLYMQDASLAILVFDGQREDAPELLRQWDRDLSRIRNRSFSKLLVAGRVDVGGVRAVGPTRIEKFAQEHGYRKFLETSALSGAGCQELKAEILAGINWETVPWRSSPKLFKALKEGIVRLKEEGNVLMRFKEIREALQIRIIPEVGFSDDELKTVIGLLATSGLLWELRFGSWILLQPEQINFYAQAVIRTILEDKREHGTIAEDALRDGKLTYPSSMKRLEKEEERVVLLAMYQTLVERGVCLKVQTETGAILLFPSFYRRERSELTYHPEVLVNYRFEGLLDEVYATLVVRLSHAAPFESDQLWRYAADFKTLTGKKLGLKLVHLGEGVGQLDIFFDNEIPEAERIIFSKYVHEHLLSTCSNVVRLRHYVCPTCKTAANREVAYKRLVSGKVDMVCSLCEESRIPLWDDMERLFASEETKQAVKELRAQSSAALDNESKEKMLVGEVISIVAAAGQLSRDLSFSDHGIDMEIEFKSDEGLATGSKLYLQLKSGDSHLKKNRYGEEVFAIKNPRHAQYWRDQQFPVFLVIRSSKGEIRWMEIRERLRENHKMRLPKKLGKDLIFRGERFDVASVRRWREKCVAKQRVRSDARGDD